jgi:hypothetical protein
MNKKILIKLKVVSKIFSKSNSKWFHRDSKMINLILILSLQKCLEKLKTLNRKKILIKINLIQKKIFQELLK